MMSLSIFKNYNKFAILTFLCFILGILFLFSPIGNVFSDFLGDDGRMAIFFFYNIFMFFLAFISFLEIKPKQKGKLLTFIVMFSILIFYLYFIFGIFLFFANFDR
jgi:hypothetical protein